MTTSNALRANCSYVSEAGDELSAKCPWHNDNSPSLRINIKLGVYICHGCGQKGSLKRLGEEAGDKLVLPDIHDYVLSKLRPQRRSDPVLSEALLVPFKTSTDYWTKVRGLSPATCKLFELGTDHTKKVATMPMRNYEGKLIGVIERQLHRNADGPKYHYPFGVTKQHHLYGAWLIEGGRVCLVEGQVDALALWDIGIPAVAMMGSVLDPKQVRIMKQCNVTEVVIFTDNDPEGEKALDNASALLSKSGILWSIADYGRSKAKDPAAMRPSQRGRAVSNALRQIDLIVE